MKAWHSLEVTETLQALGTDPERGISADEALRRLSTYGPNALEETGRKSPLIRFLLQFNDFMIWVLIAAIIISGALLREYVDALVIFVIVLLNAILGFVQEGKAESALEKLKELGAPTVKVIRGDGEVEIAARDLVPGDLMVIETGDAVTADARLVTAVNLRANESSLTGESEAVSKFSDAVVKVDTGPADRLNMVFSGTHIDYGRGTAVVVATGSHTELGQIAGMLQEGKEKATPLQLELRDVGKRIVYICLMIVAVVFVVGLIRSYPWATMLLVAVSLAVAAIPEGLPAIVTITLARGTQVMARQNAIIRNLPAVETLGSANYICTDKTGTLTMNRMTVTDIVFADAFHHLVEDILHERVSWQAGAYSRMELAAALCNDARRGPEGYIGDSTEVALLEAAESGGLDKDDLEEEYPRVAEVPFDSDRKMMTTAHRDNGGFIVFSKGAVEVVLEKCDRMLTGDGEVRLTPDARSTVLAATTELGSQALRTLAVAYRKLDSLPGQDVIEGLERDLVFLGAFAMKDPPRPEAFKALQECRRARIDVAMITGDHRATAAAVARELDILAPDRHLVEGYELEKMTQEQLTDRVEEISVYARVSPRHKVNIVEALQARGHVVAMTGDGVNDAPALKRADIGVAMGITGTDVAKEASDMVLADDNFATIVAAVRQGRIIFANLKKFIYFLLSCNISEVLTVFIAIIAFKTLPLVASQILWINLVTDGLPALALGMDPPETDVMEHPPRKIGENILAVPRQLDLLWQGLIITAGALASFILANYWLGYSWYTTVGLDMARTVLFTTMVLTQVFHSFNLRSERKSIFSSWPWENLYLFGAFLISIALQLAVLYLPFMHTAFHTHAPSAQAWALILACSLIPVLLIDRIKVLRAHIRAR